MIARIIDAGSSEIVTACDMNLFPRGTPRLAVLIRMPTLGATVREFIPARKDGAFASNFP